MTPVEIYGRLAVKGSRLVGSSQRPVALHGMSLFWSQWGFEFFNKEAVDWLASQWKIDVVRAPLGVHNGGYCTDPAAQVERVRVVIDAAIAAGIYVIVDWHAHAQELEPARRFFEKIARDYAHFPNVIFELWNEPGPQYDWDRDIRPYHTALLGHLRAFAPDSLVILGTETWSQRVDKAAERPVDDHCACYALHFYAGTHGEALRRCAERAIAGGIALFVSEWGTCNADGGGAINGPEVRRWWDFIDKHNLSDVNWAIFDKDETSSALLPGASPLGGWPAAQISASGTLALRRLRERYDQRRVR